MESVSYSLYCLYSWLPCLLSVFRYNRILVRDSIGTGIRRFKYTGA